MNRVQEMSLALADKAEEAAHAKGMEELTQARGMDNPYVLTHAYNVAIAFAGSKLVPPHFQGDVDSCLIAIFQAKRMQEDPLAFMQNSFVVGGRFGYGAPYLIARARLQGFTFDWNIERDEEVMVDLPAKGRSRQPNIIVTCTLLQDGERVGVEAVDLWMAHADGWTKNPKYKSMPERMLKYRSATWALRLYAPEVILGMQTVEELEDVWAAQAVGAEQARRADEVSALRALVDTIDAPALPDQGGSAIVHAAMAANAATNAALDEQRAVTEREQLIADVGKACAQLSMKGGNPSVAAGRNLDGRWDKLDDAQIRKDLDAFVNALADIEAAEVEADSDDSDDSDSDDETKSRGRRKMTEAEKNERRALVEQLQEREEDVEREDYRAARAKVWGKWKVQLGRCSMEQLREYEQLLIDALPSAAELNAEVEEAEARNAATDADAPPPEPTAKAEPGDGGADNPIRQHALHWLEQLSEAYGGFAEAESVRSSIYQQLQMETLTASTPLHDAKVLGGKLQAATLRKRIVNTYQGIQEALGEDAAGQQLASAMELSGIPGRIKDCDKVTRLQACHNHLLKVLSGGGE